MPRISQKDLLTKVNKNVIEEGLAGEGDTVFVALSGGPDSVCLFDVLLKLREKLKINLKACHFNHNLRGEASDADEKFVEKLCNDAGIELISGRWENKPKDKNISEDEAREVRYDFFSKILKSGRGDVKIAIAHNSNDLAETFFQRIIRGTGLKGLKSIPFRRQNFIRPLLQISRDEIIGYLELNNIKYRTDETNFDTKYLRNKIRHELLPKLTEFNPRIIEVLGSTATAISDDYDYIAQEAENELAKMEEGKGLNKIILNHKAWTKLHASLQRLTLRLALLKLGGDKDINYSHIENARILLLKRRGRKMLPIPHHLQIRFERGKIIVSVTK